MFAIKLISDLRENQNDLGSTVHQLQDQTDHGNDRKMKSVMEKIYEKGVHMIMMIITSNLFMTSVVVNF